MLLNQHSIFFQILSCSKSTKSLQAFSLCKNIPIHSRIMDGNKILKDKLFCHFKNWSVKILCFITLAKLWFSYCIWSLQYLYNTLKPETNIMWGYKKQFKINIKHLHRCIGLCIVESGVDKFITKGLNLTLTVLEHFN